MIKYQLVCDSKHEFEGWFQTSAAFDAQNLDGILTCPVCDSSNVRRALMTPNLASPKRRSVSVSSISDVTSAEPTQGSPNRVEDPPFVSGASAPAATAAAVGEAMFQLRQLQRKIKSDCRDVGSDFAEEARKIHYGESVPENIFGQSTEEERDALADEGIDFVAMPWLPPEH